MAIDSMEHKKLEELLAQDPGLMERVSRLSEVSQVTAELAKIAAEHGLALDRESIADELASRLNAGGKAGGISDEELDSVSGGGASQVLKEVEFSLLTLGFGCLAGSIGARGTKLTCSQHFNEQFNRDLQSRRRR